jgi:hypothetical protein
MTIDPNSFDQEIKPDANANPAIPDQGTEPDKTVLNTIPDGTPDIDYKEKFKHSSQEAIRLAKEVERLEREKAAGLSPTPTADVPIENLYPGFENLGPDEQKNLLDFTNVVTNKAREDLYKDPAIAFARETFNGNKWEAAFAEVSAKFPELAKSKNEFKSKYFNPKNNVPDNIGSILEDLAKVHLFDKAKEIGAQQERDNADRIDLERNTGGDKTPPTKRSLSDWQRMAQENPGKFASLQKEYQADLASGHLRE